MTDCSALWDGPGDQGLCGQVLAATASRARPGPSREQPRSLRSAPVNKRPLLLLLPTSRCRAAAAGSPGPLCPHVAMETGFKALALQGFPSCPCGRLGEAGVLTASAPSSPSRETLGSATTSSRRFSQDLIQSGASQGTPRPGGPGSRGLSAAHEALGAWVPWGVCSGVDVPSSLPGKTAFAQGTAVECPQGP